MYHSLSILRHAACAVALCLAFFLLLSCGQLRKTAKAEYRTLDTISVSARNNPMEIFRAASPRVWELVHSAITLRFDFPNKEAQGEALLSIMPYTAAPDTLVLDAKSMSIIAVSLKDFTNGKPAPLPYKYDGEQLMIDVRNVDFGSQAIRRQQTFRIEYIAKPYATSAGGSAAITEDRGLYFINTDKKIPGKPVQIWTQGETESNSHWMPTIDKPNQRSTFTISLIVPDTVQTLSNGRLAGSTAMAGGLRKDEWQMPQPIQVYAAMFAIGRFAITKEEWKDAQGLAHEVSYYTEPAFASTAAGMFKNTPEMMSYFSKVTGVSYPWNKYSQVVVRDYVSGAMENTTASLFGEWANKNRRQLLDETNEDVVSHELFHQWFGDYVTAESWSNLTLNESFATYGEQLWRAYKHGKASADELAQADLDRYLATTRLTDPPLVRYHYRSREELFDRVSYQKGASILRYIHHQVGDTLFSRAMERYLRSHALESAEAADWRQALETVTGKDWMPFFNQWYFRGGHPVLNVRYDYDKVNGKLNVTLRQKTSPDSSFKYELRLNTAVVYDSANRREDVWNIKERTHTFSYYADANGKLPVIIPDVAHVLPGVIREDKAVAEWSRQLRFADDYISKRRAIDALVDNIDAAGAVSAIKQALNDKTRGITHYTLQKIVGITKTASRNELTPQVRYLLQTSGDNKVRGAAFNVLGAWKDKSELPAMIAAVDDSSYYVAGLALQALTNIDADTAYLLAQEALLHEPKSNLQTAAWTAIVSKGNPKEIERFRQIAPQVYGGEKIMLAMNLQRYARAVKDDGVYEQALALLTEMTAAESIKSYRFAIGSMLYELRDAYKKKGESSRRILAEQYSAKVLAGETDPENISRYKSLSK